MLINPFFSSLLVDVSEFGPLVLSLVVIVSILVVLLSKEHLSKKTRALLITAFVSSVLALILAFIIKKFFHQIG